MKFFPQNITLMLLIATILFSCINPTAITETPETSKMKTTVPTDVISIAPTPTKTPQEITAYYDGVVVLTQYYTFLGNGLHENAYYLMSDSAQKQYLSFEHYLEMAQNSFHQIEIVQIVPYKDWAPLFGLRYFKDTADEKQFVVQIKAWGEGNMSGSALNGQLQTLYVMQYLRQK